MDRTQEIKEAIRAIGGGRGGGLWLVGEVKSVEGESCTVEVGGMELTEVRLTAVNDGGEGKLTLTPEAGSRVLVADLSDGAARELAVVGFSTVAKIEGTVERVAMTADSMELNGGENGGLVNIEQLKQWMQNVETDMTTLKTLLQSSPIAGNGAPAAIVFNPQTKSVASNIEDAKITH